MKLSSVRVLGLASVLCGCALEITATSEDPDAAVGTADAAVADAAVSPADTPRTEADAVTATDAPRGCTTEALPTLVAATELGVEGPVLSLVAADNAVRDGCSTWYGGRDATAVFRAPAAGRYTFSALGNQLWNLSVRRPCADAAGERACARFTDFHGGMPFSRPLTATVRLEAEEAVAVVADGCPTGAGISCRWTLRVQHDPPRGCFDADRGCGEGSRCLTPPGGALSDSVCQAGHRPVVLSARAFLGGTTLRFVGNFRDDDEDANQLQVRLLDANNMPLHPTHFERLYANVPADGAPSQARGSALVGGLEATRRVEFVAVDTLGLRSEAVRVDVEDAPVRAEGAVCDTTHIEDVCATDTRCTTEGRCVRLVQP